MEERKRFSFSDLRVGIFVILGGVVLAVAIFRIGSTVGLFQETFQARTYLNNVSGLKPGDIVLLGGVEIGNVTRVRISTPENMPDTAANRKAQREISDLSSQRSQLAAQLKEIESELDQTQGKYDAAVAASGAGSKDAQALESVLEAQRKKREQLSVDLERAEDEVQRARDALQNIVVDMEIQTQYRDWIRADSYISLGSVGLLGDKYIEISLGRSPEAPKTVTEEKEGFLWGTEEVHYVEITGRPQAGFEELITGANDILVNFRTLSEKVNDIVRRFESGEGTVGKFLTDPAFYNNLNDTVLTARDTVQHAGRLMTDLTEGHGTISNLIYREELYDKLTDSVGRLERILADVEAGQGTAGRLIKDPELYEKARDTMASMASISSRIDSGEGTLGKLTTDDQLYQELNQTLQKMSGFVGDIEQGKGTLGRLAKDEQLYENINQLSAELVKLIYDFRQNPKKFLTIKFKLF